MNCPICAQVNLAENKFCATCGAVLDVSGMKLRLQILEIIQREFKNQELVAVEVADKAEDRLWRWSKLLGFALTLFLAGAGFFGFTSYKEAKSRIGDAAQAAVTGLNQVADQNKQTIVGKGAEAISQMQLAEGSSVSQIQSQTRSMGSQVAALVSRAKASSSQLQQAEQSVIALQARVAPLQKKIEALATIRDSSPDTPIGDINSGLFSSSGYGAGGYGSGSYGGATALGGLAQPTSISGIYQPPITIVWPYKEGATGHGVAEIQSRLYELGCLSGAQTGTFDEATTAAVTEFLLINGRPLPGSLMGLLNTSEDAPTVLYEDTSPGTVDYQVWAEIFDPNAQKCEWH